MKKHIAALALCIAMAFPAVTNAAQIEFTDLDKVPWKGAETYIQKVADLGYMVGDYDANGKRVFRPKDNITYCESVQMIYSILKNANLLTSQNSFVDKWKAVMQGYNIPEWAYTSVSYALENNIVSISELSKFVKNGKQQSPSREEVCTFFGKGLSVKYTIYETGTLTFKDSAQITASAAPDVELLSR
ncbi:MAG: S-layer homology domain-containing protein, partial [Firmicutes bacterium]|nr:S-layer homology domain-containing protein [Bacillota bacterium]